MFSLDEVKHPHLSGCRSGERAAALKQSEPEVDSAAVD